MKKYKAILFDFDGVIGQTLEDNFKAWAHSFSSIGGSIEYEQYALLEGRKGEEIVKILLAETGFSESYAELLIERKNEFYSAHNTFALYHGIEEVVQKLLDKGVKLAIVSGGNGKRLKNTTPAHLFNKFAAIVSAEHCKVGKPSPEPYLTGARMLDVSPAECLVIENAPLGIESAKNAGMECIAVCSTLDAKHLAMADWVVKDIKELEGFLFSRA